MKRSLLCLACALLCILFASTAVAEENKLRISGIATYQDEMYAVDLSGQIYRAKTPNNWEIVIDAEYSDRPVLMTWGGNTLYYIAENNLYNENSEMTKIDYILHRATMADDGSLMVDKEAVALDVPDVITDMNDDYVFRKMIFVKDRLLVLVQSDRNYVSSGGPFDLWSVNPETGDVKIVVQRQDIVDIFPAKDRFMTKRKDRFYTLYEMDGEKQELFYKLLTKNFDVVVSFYDQDTDTLYYSAGTTLFGKTGDEEPQRIMNYMPPSANNAMGYDAVICNGNLVVLDRGNGDRLFYTPLRMEEGQILTIPNALLQDEQKFLMDYQEQHQDTKFQTVEMTWDEVAQMLNTHGDQLTVMSLNSKEGYAAILDKGYYVDLAQDKAIAEAVARMSPFARDLVTDENGRIAALPYALYSPFGSCYFLTYNRQVLTDLGMTEADLPTTAGELLTMIEAWLQRDISEDDEYNLFATIFEGSQNFEYLRRMLMYLQAATCMQEGELVQFNTPAMRDLLTRLDALEDVFEDCCGDEMALAQPEHSLFTMWASVMVEYREALEDMLCLPLAIDDAHQPIMPMEVKLLAVNPYAEEADQQEAVNLLSDLATSFRPWNQVLFFPDANEPYTDPQKLEQAKNNLFFYQNMLSNKKEALETCVDHEERTALEIEIADLEEVVADCINPRPNISAEDIAAYRKVESAIYPLTYDWMASDTVQQLYSRYVQGNITVETFLKQVDEVLRMQQMEDQ